MSYSLESKCAQCQLEEKCTDQAILQGAIGTIHSINWSVRKGGIIRGHLGGGIVRLDCQNFRAQEEQPIKT